MTKSLLNYRTTLNCLAIGVLCANVFTSITSATTFRTVALTGQQAPGKADGIEFAGFSLPIITASGDLSIVIPLLEPGVNRNLSQIGLWVERDGFLTQVVADALSLPDGNGGEVSMIRQWMNVSDDGGRIAITGSIAGFELLPHRSDGIWMENFGSYRLVARAGMTAPGAGEGVEFAGMHAISINDAGRTSFIGDLRGPDVDLSNHIGLWSEGHGELRLVARTGVAAPGTSPGTNFRQFGYFGPLLNNSGDIAFLASLTQSGHNVPMDSVWSDGGDTLQLVAQGGDAAPGTESGITFESFEFLRFNDAGHLSFVAELSGPNIEDQNGRGIWSRQDGDGLQLIARAGDPAPGAGDGIGFGNQFYGPLLNDEGETTFWARLTGEGVDSTNNSGIWSEGNGSLHLVARTGSPAPGGEPGLEFSGLAMPLLNNRGQAVFFALVQGEGVDSTNDRGIWAELEGDLKQVLRTGDVLEVMPGDFRTVAMFDFAGGGNEDFRPSFNDRGELTFLATFTDGSSGVFVADLGIIPEPTSVVLLFIAVAILPWHRHRI